MSEAEREIAFERDLQVAPPDVTEVGLRIRGLLEAIIQTKISDPEVRQLWLETHWIKSDYEQGILVIPVGWELMIYQIGRGQVSPNIRRHPKIVEAAASLAAAMRVEIKKRAE